MKISKKTKLILITFVALGFMGIAIIKVKQIIDKRREKKNKQSKNKTISIIFELPDALK
tara:strand:- start:135 stop:311 length:177 start_codon:yes stop_codon:yes gene_type:complete